MTHEDEKRTRAPAKDRRPDKREGKEPTEKRGGGTVSPEPEEAPELLGERSDYPIPFDDSEPPHPRPTPLQKRGEGRGDHERAQRESWRKR